MLTLPNLLTLSRILAVPILVFLLWKPSWWDYAITFVLYCLVGITDYFDGYLARAQGTVSRLGIFLDPIADKIMVAAVIVMLIARPPLEGEPDHRRLAPDPGAGDPAARDHRLGAARIPREPAHLGAGQPARQVEDGPDGRARRPDPRRRRAAMGMGPHLVGLASLWAAAGLTLVTGWDYLRVGLKHMD